MERATCKSCGAQILWVRTARGLAVPLDAEPQADGIIDIHQGLVIDVPTDMPQSGRPLYRSHFSSCPDAAKYRRGHR